MNNMMSRHHGILPKKKSNHICLTCFRRSWLRQPSCVWHGTATRRIVPTRTVQRASRQGRGVRQLEPPGGYNSLIYSTGCLVSSGFKDSDSSQQLLFDDSSSPSTSHSSKWETIVGRNHISKSEPSGRRSLVGSAKHHTLMNSSETNR